MSLIGPVEIKEMFEGISDANREFIFRSMRPQFTAAISKINAVSAGKKLVLCPAAVNILAPFKHFDIATDTRVVLLGQDPYPNLTQAIGLSFAVGGKKTPPSATNIYDCIAKTCRQAADLSTWPAQGVLMMNCAFTTIAGKSAEHTVFWREYTDELIAKIAKIPRPIVFILLGAFAKEKEALIRAAGEHHHVFTWGHPSPLNRENNELGPKHFSNCDVFAKTNAVFAANPIRWGAQIPIEDVIPPAVFSDDEFTPIAPAATIYLFADGGALANGKPNCTSSWAFCITIDRTFERTITQSGRVLGEQSNNRGELTGIMKGLAHIVENAELRALAKHITIISDSKYALNTIFVWSTAWMSSADTLKDKCNLDLVLPAYVYQNTLSKTHKITHEHVHGHKDEMPRTDPRWFHWKGNDICDKLCTDALK